MEQNKVRIIGAATGGLLLIASLTQESYCTGGCGHSLTAFLLGWMGMLVEAAAFFDSVMSKLGGHDREIKTGVVATLPWLANPLLIVSFFTIRHSAKTTLVLSVLSALLMLLFLCVDTIIDNEAGSHGTVTGYKAGYWLWVASSVFMMLASLYFWKKEKAKE